VNLIIVFNVIGSSRKFVYPTTVNVMMGLSEANDLFKPDYSELAVYKSKPALSGIQMAGETARKGIIENLILNLMNRTKNKFTDDKSEDEKKDENSRRTEIKVQKPENPKPKEIEEDDGDLDEL